MEKIKFARDVKWNLSGHKDVMFTHDGCYFVVNNDLQYFITHNELRTLNKLRKKYNYMFKDELTIAREEAQDEQG